MFDDSKTASFCLSNIYIWTLGGTIATNAKSFCAKTAEICGHENNCGGVVTGVNMKHCFFSAISNLMFQKVDLRVG